MHIRAKHPEAKAAVNDNKRLFPLWPIAAVVAAAIGVAVISYFGASIGHPTSVWLWRDILKVMIEMHERQSVPCNGCIECCRNDLLVLHPELGD